MGISPLLDQRLAGFVMMTERALSLGTFALVLHLSSRPRPAVAPRMRRRQAVTQPLRPIACKNRLVGL